MHRFSFTFVIVAAVSFCLPLRAGASGTTPKQWDVETSVSVRLFGGDVAPMLNAGKNHVVLSPDEKYFYTTFSWGDLDCDCRVRELVIYDVIDVQRWAILPGSGKAPNPVVRLVRRGPLGSGKDPMKEFKWSEQGGSLIFIASEGFAEEVYQVLMPTGKLSAVTSDGRPKVLPFIGEGAVVYSGPEKQASSEPQERRIYLPLNRSGKIEFDFKGLGNATRDTIISFNDGRTWNLGELNPGIGPALMDYWFSPNSRFLAIRAQNFVTTDVRYYLADLHHWKLRRIDELESALSNANVERVSWEGDRTLSGLASSTASPFEPLSRKFSVRVAAMRAAVEDLKTPVERTLPAIIREQGVEQGSRSSLNLDGVEIKIHEDLNTAQVLTVNANGRQKALLAPNDWLKSVQVSKTDLIDIKLSDGRTVRGQLTVPTRPIRTPLPLVIQLSAAEVPVQYFYPDGGPVPANFARQSLAARGMAVLSLDISKLSRATSAQEISSSVDLIDSAVGQLVKDRLVDPARVACLGFSRSGYVCHAVASHPGETKMKAVVISDSVTLSLFGDVEQYLYSSLEQNMDFYGGSFWQNKPAWFQNDPILNADRITAAVLLFDHDERNLSHPHEFRIDSKATIAALARNRVPFDFITIPDAGHYLTRPSDWAFEMEATVDWLALWLLGQRDPDPSKIKQYRRWDAQIRNSKVEAPPIH
ncbi:prolyl oligopeptidase family serine peptidase [Altererythrobacter soli]|uniref:Prolyl oligopeptidase family serine peptidase n=1 Tax=Croceibacterium soli TaxID=1739690 RepID=A0A6I4UR74_9SPHN|nr:prolyl oligopeptidase family serine peptidase [Croceibacterium soli]MXP41138.1 prolyl oligopeptidase family serine peptidase [Croceibacterium soli]